MIIATDSTSTDWLFVDSTNGYDPVQALVDFLRNLGGDAEMWQRVLDEPYG